MYRVVNKNFTKTVGSPLSFIFQVFQEDGRLAYFYNEIIEGTINGTKIGMSDGSISVDHQNAIIRCFYDIDLAPGSYDYEIHHIEFDGVVYPIASGTVTVSAGGGESPIGAIAEWDTTTEVGNVTSLAMEMFTALQFDVSEGLSNPGFNPRYNVKVTYVLSNTVDDLNTCLYGLSFEGGETQAWSLYTLKNYGTDIWPTGTVKLMSIYINGLPAAAWSGDGGD